MPTRIVKVGPAAGQSCMGGEERAPLINLVNKS